MEVNKLDLIQKKALFCALCDQTFSSKEEYLIHWEHHNAIKP